MSHDSVSVTLTHGPTRGWQQRWRQMAQGFRKLEAIYEGTSRYNDMEEWETLVYAFFSVCHHMADWFQNDPALPPAVRDDAFPHLKRSGDLTLAAAFSNTSKHLSRQRDTDVTAYVLSVSDGSSGAGSVLLAWDVNGVRGGTRDALDLAVACLTSWRDYLRLHGLAEPG